MTGMPAWLRRSHAPGWRYVVEAAAPGREKKHFDRIRSESRWELDLSLAVAVYDFNDRDQ